MQAAPNPLDRVLTVATFLLLLAALVVGLGPNVSTKAVQLGEAIWPGYAAQLRADPEEPDCVLDELNAKLEQCPADVAPAPKPDGDDPFGGEDPFADPEPEPAPKPAPAAEPDPFDGEDPFAEPEPAPKPAPAAEPDPFGGEDPFAEPEPAPKPAPAAEPDPFADEDPFAEEDPFADEAPAAPKVNCAALTALRDRCATNWDAYTDTQARLTSGVRTFRSVELAVSSLAKFPFHKHMLVLLVLLGGLQTTRHRVHIALRDPANTTEHRISQLTQLLAHLAWLVSCIADWQVQQGSAEVDNPALPVIWAVGFLVLAGVNVLHLVRTPAFSKPVALTPARALMVVPLFAWMSIIGAVWFQAVEQHPSGQAIFLHKFVQIPSIYVGIGLYIWAGMMLARTQLAQLVFATLVPWRLPPNILAWLVVVLAALPTAYSGASGIFVIAAGAVIFDRLTEYGARPRIALAATAMSGSLGVVLRPCLVVVLVAVLNKEVTTDSLFGWGYIVFALTAFLFLLAMLTVNDQRIRMPGLGGARDAASGTARALRPLIPYLAIGIAMVLIYRFLLGTPVTEHTAAFVLPGVLLAVVLWDRWAPSEGDSTWSALTNATGESAHHIGALLFVMAGSVGIGGVVERSEAMSVLPENLGSPFTAMTFLVVVMVLVGMTMDALGAVILVSVTLKHVALANGIDPIHFWMMVLCAFELGYLTPPVALNHLLARQVIGEPADMSEVDAGSWFERYEHILLPMIVMGTALILVAYVPLLVGYR